MSKPIATGQPTVGIQYSPALPDIDWQKIRKGFENQVRKSLRAFKREIEIEWNYQAQQQMKTTAAKYMEGVSFTLTSDGVDVFIQGWLPVALEQGTTPYDLKPGFLKGRTSRVIPLEGGKRFRTVSTNSPPGSWWHPGIKAKGIANIMEGKAQEISKRTVEKDLMEYFKRVEI